MSFLIESLLNLAMKHRALVVVMLFILIAFGIMAYQNLSIEAYPDFTSPMVRVITILPGKGAEEVERLVTIPLEKELNGIPGQTNLRSISIFGLSVVTVTFRDETSSNYARQQVLQRIGNADLPDMAKPELDPDATPIGEIYRYTLSSRYYNPMSLKAIEDWQLEKEFRQIPGVIDVTSFGGPTKNYQVNIDADSLKAYHLSIAQVFDAISRSNGTTGGSYIENNGQAYIVRGLGLLKGVNDLANVVISTNENGTPIRVKDVATISIGPGVRLGQVGKNIQDDVVQGIVLMRRGENPSQVIERIYEKLPEIEASLPTGVKLIPLYDRMDLMRKTMDTISHNVAEGIVLVVAVLLLFMFEVRSALITATVIPLALLIAFILLDVFRIPANLLSLGAVDFGIIVDGTVVMVENIHRELANNGQNLPVSGRIALTLHAAKEVGKPIFFATFIIFSAFLPIFAFDGVAGKLFHPLAFTMNFALIGSVLVSMTIIPVLCSYFLTGKPLVHKESPFLKWAEKVYSPLLHFNLRRPWLLLGLSSMAVIFSFMLFPHIGSEFLPNLDEGNIWLRVTVLPTSVALEKSVSIAHIIREKLIQYPEVKNVVSQAGSPDDGTDPNTPSNIEFLVDLKPAAQWRKQWHEEKDALIDSMDKNLKDIPGIVPTFSQYIQDNVDEAISGAKGEVAVKLYGPDLDILEHLGDKIAAIMNRVPGLVDVADDKILGQPQYRIQINREQADRYGINVSDINQLVEIAIGGKVATQMQEGERRFNVLVRFKHSYRSNLGALQDILINTPSGETIPLSEVASIVPSTGATEILREDNARLITIKANVRGRDLGSAVAEAQRLVQREVKIPEGYKLSWGGQFENQQHANARLAIIIPITLGIIFLILFGLFGKIRDILIAMLPIPLVAFGGILALFLTHTYFSVSAGVGFLAAAGVSVQNGVIILSRIRKLQQAGISKCRSIIKGAQARLSPVLMAGVVAILGLLPAATSNGIGSQSQKPFAIVIIGGLLSATFLSIFIIPVVYSLIISKDSDPDMSDNFSENESEASFPSGFGHSKNLVPLLFIFLCAVSLLTGCGSQTKIPKVPSYSHTNNNGPIQIRLTQAQENTINLATETVHQVPFPVKVKLNGKIQAANNLMTHVYTPVPGKVTGVAVSLGQHVATGQLLATIKSDQVGQLEADLLQQNLQNDADIRQAKVQLNFSQMAYHREQKLFNDRISAKADLDAARTQYEKDADTLKSLLSKRQAIINAYQERLSLYGVNSGIAAEVVRSRHITPYISITAPQDGFVITRNINNGELADPNKELFSIADLSKVWVIGNVYEKDINKVQKGQPVRITVDSFPGRVFTGVLNYVADILDPQTRTLDLRAEVPNRDLSLKPNMFANMEILTKMQRVMAVPTSAIQRFGDYTFAYVEVNPHLFREQPVTVGPIEGPYAQITSGLNLGDKIATHGTLFLKGESLKMSSNINP